jgi:hypothetical protein
MSSTNSNSATLSEIGGKKRKRDTPTTNQNKKQKNYDNMSIDQVEVDPIEQLMTQFELLKV